MTPEQRRIRSERQNYLEQEHIVANLKQKELEAALRTQLAIVELKRLNLCLFEKRFAEQRDNETKL